MAYTPSSPDNIRLTITVTPEVHAAFKRLAAASGMSIGRAMGEWMGDMLEAVEFTASKVEEARAAPKVVMQEMHAYALGLADETGALLQKMREEGRRARGDAPAPHAPASLPLSDARKARAAARRAAGVDDPVGQEAPRLVIRGGKSPKAGKGQRS